MSALAVPVFTAVWWCDNCLREWDDAFCDECGHHLHVIADIQVKQPPLDALSLQGARRGAEGE